MSSKTFYQNGADEALKTAKEGDVKLATFKILMYIFLLLIDKAFEGEQG